MRKVKLLLTAALSLMAWTGTMATVTQPTLTTDPNNPAFYTIKNLRTGKYATYTGASSQLSQEANLTKAGLWFFEENGDGVSIIPAKDPSVKLASNSSATSTGAVWYLVENPHRAGYFCVTLSNNATSNCWDDQGQQTKIGYWQPSATDNQGTSWIIEPFDVQNPIEVTYEIYDGETKVSSATVVQGANMFANPIPGTGINYNGFFHEKFYYDYTPESTVGDTDCTIRVNRTEKAGVVHALSDLSNTKAYNIGCDRGAMIAFDGKMVNTALNNAEANAQPYGKFALLNYEGNYYIFSIDENKFVKNDASVALDLTTVGFSTEDAMVMVPQNGNEPYFLWHFNAKDKYLNTNGNTPLGYVINDYSTPDPGNLYYMVAVDDFDPTAALAELDAYFNPSYFVTYVVKDELGNTIFTSEAQPTKLGANITTLLDEFKRPYYTYNDVDVTISENETTVEFTATWTGPFEISADFATAHWYDMAMRGTWYVTSAVKDGDGAYKTQNANTMGLVEDSYQWAFIGDGYNGFKIINKAEGEGKSFGWTDAQQTNAGVPTVMDDSEGHHAWNIVPSTNTSVPAGSFCLNVPGTNLYINQYGGAGGSVKFWNSTNNLGDEGSAFTVFDVPSNFASYLVDEGIAAEYDATGYFAFTDAAKATLGWDPAYKTDCPFDTYKSLKENLPAAKADLSNFVLPETGYYTLKNKNYSTYMGIDPSDANMYGNYAAANLPKHIVKLTKNADNTYTIGLMGKFAPATVTKSGQVTATAEAGTYTVVIPALGYAAFQADTNEQFSALHCASGGSIVGWETAAAASQWQVADAESIQLEVGEAGYATAYLPFPATPAGVYDISVPEALGTWTFDDAANLTAGSGKATLALYGDGVTATDGPDASNGAVSAPVGGGFLLDTHLSEVSSAYTFMFDVSFPDVSGYNCLFQNDVNFDSSKDGSFFIKNGQVGFNSAGLGYKGTINTNEWHRIVVVMNDSRCTLYLDGTQIGGPTSAQDVRAWSMKDNKQFLLFIDNDGEEKVTNAAEIRFWAQALTAEEVAKLGAAGNVPQPKQSDMKVYIATLAESASGHSQYLSLDELGGTIPEATPVILKASPEKYVFAVGEKAEETVPDGALEIFDDEANGSEALVKGLTGPLDEVNVLKGTLEPIDAVGKYVLAKPEGKEVGFYLAESGKIAAGKAYLEIPEGSNIKAFYFLFPGEDPTGISEVENGKLKVESSIYNLAGQRISKMQQGINIVNGKKILK